MAVVYIGLGSNIGDRTQHLVDACATLHRHPAIAVQAVSSLYHTAPVGFTAQGWFLNAVARLDTTLSPPALLGVTQAAERQLGRVPTWHWGPRITIPHAALHERRFVLVPLAELAPDLQLPSGVRVRDLLSVLPEDNDVQRLGPFPAFADGQAS